MTAKDFLRGIRDNERRVKALQETRQRYYDIAMTGTSGVEATRLSGTSQRSRVEDAVCAMVDMCSDLDKEIDALQKSMRFAEHIISGLHDRRHQYILRCRYLNGWSWSKIATEMGFDRRWVLRLHGQALICFEDCLRFPQRMQKSH